MTKQTWTAAVAAVLFVALAAVVSLVPVPFVSWSAGATVNLFEPVDDQPRVDITGVETFPQPASCGSRRCRSPVLTAS